MAINDLKYSFRSFPFKTEIKSTLGFHSTPIGMAMIKGEKMTINAGRDMGKEEPLFSIGSVNPIYVMETSMALSKRN